MNAEQKQDQDIIMSVKKEWDNLSKQLKDYPYLDGSCNTTNINRSQLESACDQHMRTFLVLTKFYRKIYGVDYTQVLT